MISEHTIFQEYTDLVQRINDIIARSEPEHQLDQILNLVVQVARGQMGILYLHDTINDNLILHSVSGFVPIEDLIGTHVPIDGHIAYAMNLGRAILVQNVSMNSLLLARIGSVSYDTVPITYFLPLMLSDQSVGLIQILSFRTATIEDIERPAFLNLVSMMLAPHVDRIRQTKDAKRREKRLIDLIEIISCMSTTLERDKLLDDIMNYAQDLLDVEATSIWIKDDHTGDLVLHVATGERVANIREIRVPPNQGIIGNVVSNGRGIIVNDVSQDTHFYRAIDKRSGFQTRSIMCVPLQAPKIVLGGERGVLQETIIGGAQALNKRDGQPFSEEDQILFEMLAHQAATILQLAELYTELARLYNELSLLFNETRRLSEQNYKMFWGIVKGISSFIDRKDPYTRGHSQRVADFSVCIAKEMKLPQDMIQHILIGGILHDVGKIAVPDHVLKKPSRLTDEEMVEMKQHPQHGIDLLEESDLIWLLPHERQAIEEHHERLDGKGYPKGLKGKRETLDENGEEDKQGISLIGRIVAVADAFDAMTSDRPYRPGMSVEKAFQILREVSGTEFDPVCVEALIQAREKGFIKMQRERDDYYQIVPPTDKIFIDETQTKEKKNAVGVVVQ